MFINNGFAVVGEELRPGLLEVRVVTAEIVHEATILSFFVEPFDAVVASRDDVRQLCQDSMSNCSQEDESESSEGLHAVQM